MMLVLTYGERGLIQMEKIALIIGKVFFSILATGQNSGLAQLPSWSLRNNPLSMLTESQTLFHSFPSARKGQGQEKTKQLFFVTLNLEGLHSDFERSQVKCSSGLFQVSSQIHMLEIGLSSMLETNIHPLLLKGLSDS